MHTKELLKRLEEISAEIAALYAELAKDLPDLRIVTDNARGYNSELKKMPRRKFCFSRA